MNSNTLLRRVGSWMGRGMSSRSDSFKNVLPDMLKPRERARLERNNIRGLVRTKTSTDTVRVVLPLSKENDERSKQAFDFTLKQMAMALSNLLEVRNESRNDKHRAILTRYIKVVNDITKQIDAQRFAWKKALKSIPRGGANLPNYPVTPLASYNVSNTLRYQKNTTMRILSPKVRAMLDQIGARFAIIREETRARSANVTRQFTQNAAKATTMNQLRIVKSKALKNGANINVINRVTASKELELRKVTPTPPPPSRFMNKARMGLQKARIIKSMVPRLLRRPGFML